MSKSTAATKIKLDDILEEANKLLKPAEPLNHADILDQLLDQIQPIDFKALAFPESVSLNEELSGLANGSERAKEINEKLAKFKLNIKHYLVLSIENVIAVAKENKWGLCKNLDFIYLYNGAYWEQIDKEIFQKFLGEAAEKMGVPIFEARYHIIRESLFKQFFATAYLSAPKRPKNKVLINLLNGTFEITTKGTLLRPFSQSDFLTYQLPFAYKLSAKAPIFESYLNRVLPDKETRRVLAEYLGFVFVRHGSGALKEEKALILYGSGANGKSVFFEIVNALLGRENITSHPLDILTDHDRGQSYRAKLGNVLVNYASEINRKLDTSLFKQMVSGEPISACLKYGQPFTLENYAKFIFNCNELPKDVEHTNAYFRRFLIIPFNVTIPDEEQDKMLHYKIIDNELPGVFNWVLDGLSRLLNQGRFSESEIVENAVKEYRTEADSVRMFLRDVQYTTSLVSTQPLKELYSEYTFYCSEGGYHKVSINNFGNRLRAAGYELKKQKYGQCVYIEKENGF